MKKLICDKFDVRKIKDSQENVTLRRLFRAKHGVTREEALKQRIKSGQLFWVAEPSCSISLGGKYHKRHYSTDETPKGWVRTTVPSAGSHMLYMDHRFELEAVEAVVCRNQCNELFYADVTFKVVKK